MTIHRAEHSLEIPASPEACFETIVDYETFPEWQDAVRRVEVISRNKEGLGEVVSFRVDARFREIGYRLRYHYERPGRVWWDFVSGEGVEHVEGEFRFEPTGEGTLATYVLGIDPGVPVPGLVMRRLNQQVLKRSVRDLREEIERRVG